MTITKNIAAASLLLMLLPAGQAFASTPHDLGSFQTQCMAQGGAFGLGGDADTYECGTTDGVLQVCDFGGKKPSCVSLTGPTPHRQTADNGNGPSDPNVKWDQRTFTPDPPKLCRPGSPGCV
jgi:hypothetical protein